MSPASPEPDLDAETSTAPARRWLKTAVLVGSLLCFAWVLRPILRHGQELAASVRGTALAGGIVAGAAAYAVLGILLATAWWWLTGVYGRRPSLRGGYSVWARSQLAKYLPGNVFHYVGRQILGRQAGVSHAALVASGLLEMLSLIVAAVLIATTGAALTHTPLPMRHSLPAALVVAVAGLLVWPLADRLLRRLPLTASHMADLPHLSARQTFGLLGPAVLQHLVFFAGTGLVLWVLLDAAWPDAAVPARTVVWLYAVAWAAGTLTPGAPGGVGIREAILTLELTPHLGEPRAAALAVALRLVTIGGDLVTALAGWMAVRGDRRPTV